MPSSYSLQSGGHVDAVTFFEGHDSALGIRLRTELAAEDFRLALANQRVDALHLDVEQLLNRLFDLRLGRLRSNLEHILVVLGSCRRLFRNHGRDDDVVMTRVLGAHLKRASNASTAAFVSTSFCRRRMS